jgi:hypothetical protein
MVLLLPIDITIILSSGIFQWNGGIKGQIGIKIEQELNKWRWHVATILSRSSTKRHKEIE